MRCLERMARRAELPLAQSQGLTPAPRSPLLWRSPWGSRGTTKSSRRNCSSRWSRPKCSDAWLRLAARPRLDRCRGARSRASRPGRGGRATHCPFPPTAVTKPEPPWADFWPGPTGPTPGTGPTALPRLISTVLARSDSRRTRWNPPVPPEDVPGRFRQARRGDRRPRPPRPSGTGGRPGSTEVS